MSESLGKEVRASPAVSQAYWRDNSRHILTHYVLAFRLISDFWRTDEILVAHASSLRYYKRTDVNRWLTKLGENAYTGALYKDFSLHAGVLRIWDRVRHVMELGEDLVAEADQEGNIELLPQLLWQKVVAAVNSVLDGNKYYGFVHFTYADPSIDVIVAQAKAVQMILDVVIDSPYLDKEGGNNLLINCRQSLHLIERTHASLQNGDQLEYESCISKLSSQRQY